MRLVAPSVIFIFDIVQINGAYANCDSDELCFDENIDLSIGDIITFSNLSALRSDERQRDDEGHHFDNMPYQLGMNLDIRGFSIETLERNARSVISSLGGY